jgi:hypothetical protein
MQMSPIQAKNLEIGVNSAVLTTEANTTKRLSTHISPKSVHSGPNLKRQATRESRDSRAARISMNKTQPMVSNKSAG